MHCGTTSDSFLRDNLDWLKRATNWAKFTATASLGVIHQVCVCVRACVRACMYVCVSLVCFAVAVSGGDVCFNVVLIKVFASKIVVVY